MSVESPGGRRTTLLVVASLPLGVALALVLSLVAFGGATEARITGAVLLGFASGWLLIGSATMRGGIPQRWALTPAAVLGVTGGLLILVDPGVVEMDRLNWVWPPLALALSMWVFVRARANLRGLGRMLTAAVVFALGLTSLGAYYENIAAGLDRDADKLPARTYDVAGRDLHLWCVGKGRPTVVLENGLGEASSSWVRVMAAVGARTRVCAHDRAGQGWSDAVEKPQDAVAAAADLHALLAKAGIRGPFVLVGHSTGGPFSMVFAHRHPGQVGGMVLLDSSSPQQFEMPAYPGQYAMMRRGLAFLPTLSHVGLRRLALGRHVDGVALTARAGSNVRDEVSVLPDVFNQAARLATVGDVPLVVVTAKDSLRIDGWERGQQDMVRLSSNAQWVIVPTSHAGLLDASVGARASVAAILKVLQGA